MDQLDPFPRTRAEALVRLKAFLPEAGRYASRRNHVLAGHPHVSRLSPAVRHRLVLEEELIDSALARHPFAAVEKFVQEVVWRTYWKGWLELRPGVWHGYREQVARLRECLPETTLARVAEVESGHSGVAIMDHFARELAETGYLHNHARMWFAGYWIHVERLPWELGADFFYRHLLDADPASNTLSWRWVAGLQTRGKTYLARRSNLEKYCDPALLADRRGLERLADDAVSPVEVSETADTSITASEPLPTEPPTLQGRFGIWLHGDDLAPELSPLGQLRPAAVAAFLDGRLVTHFGLSPLRAAYLDAAMTDAVARAQAHFGCDGRLIRTDSLADSMVEWARREDLQTIVALKPFVGPLLEELPSIRSCLVQAGVRLVLLRRSYDAALFPMARGGYFGFWEKTQSWLKTRPVSSDPSRFF